MKNIGKLLSTSLAALLVAATASGARAEGMGITEWSARGMSLANGLVARADDASAVAYNPAGITQIPGTTIMLGTAVSMPMGSIRTRQGGVVTSTKAKDDYWMIPHFYVTHQINDHFWFGGGVFPRFGLGNGFPSSWPGSAGITDVAVHTVTINPNIVWKVNEHLSLAAGLEFSGGDLLLRQRYHATRPLVPGGSLIDNRAKLTGRGGALGGNLALHLRFNDQWSLGLTWRSRMALNVHGKARWSQQLGGSFPGTPLQAMQDADLHGTMSLPDALGFGLAWKPRPDLSFEGNVVYTTWSNYRHLDIYLENPANYVLWAEKHWRDTWTFSASVEYRPVEWLALRAGYLYETSPMNKAHADYLVPSNGRQWYAFGAGFLWNNWTLDLAYSYIRVNSLNYDDAARVHGPSASNPFGTPLPGKSHNVHAHNVGVSLGYRF